MLIGITDYQGFIAAWLARGKDPTRPYLCGVYVEPDGRCTGTNGYMLISTRSVEPFEGEAVLIDFYGNPPKKLKSGEVAFLNLGGNFMEITGDGGKITGTISFRRVDGRFPGYFPGYKQVLTTMGKLVPGDICGFNTEYLEIIRKAFGGSGVFIGLRANGAASIVPDSRSFPADAFCVVMPFDPAKAPDISGRTSDALATL